MSFLKKYISLTIYFLSCVVPSVTAQNPELLFRHFFADNGLSHNTVYTITQDTLGFIWIGTRSGLNRFDGNGFKIYDLNQGLMDVYINILFRDTKGTLWVGTKEGGLSRYDYSKDRFESWLISGDRNYPGRNDDILSIGEDLSGRIWAGTHQGSLMIFSEEDLTFREVIIKPGPDSVAKPERINAISFDTDTTLWIGTFRGLYRLTRDLNSEGMVYTAVMKSDSWITSLCSCESGVLWAGTNQGVIKLDKNGSVISFLTSANSALTNNTVTDIERLKGGKLMIATDGGGVNIYDPSTSEMTALMSDPNVEKSLSNNAVYDVFQDKDSAIWVGNYMGGVNYTSPGDWKFVSVRHVPGDPGSLNDNHVRCFFEDSDGMIWLGTLRGISLYDKEKGIFRPAGTETRATYEINSTTVLSINEVTRDVLWIGTYNNGILRFNKKTGLLTRFTHPDDRNKSLERSSIYQILITGDEKILLTSLGGIYLFDMLKGKLSRYTSSNSALSSNTVKAACLDRNGYLWLGTNYGLNRFDPRSETFKVFVHSITEKNSLSNNRILSLIEDAAGLIWIGTEGGGVSILNPLTETFTALTANEGLPDNVINSVVQDQFGSYWFSTNKGLARYNRATGQISNFTVSDGLQGNGYYPNSFLKTTDGLLFFGGSNGFTAFDPASLKKNLLAPRVIFTDLFVSGKIIREFEEKSPVDRQLSIAKQIRLPYKSSFEIHFAVPGIPNTNKFLFSYYLKGITEEWSEFQKNTSLNFSNLPPGKYLLSVKAINNDNIESVSPASVRLTILPPWWKKWWVFIIYTIIIGSLMTILLRLNNSKIRAFHELQVQKRERQQIEELNQMKLSFFTDVSHEFKTPLTLIMGHIDNLKDNIANANRKTISVIESNARRLLMLINQLMEFRKAENGLMKLHVSRGNLVSMLSLILESFSVLARRKNISLRMTSDDHVPEVWFDSEKIEKIIYNLVYNAFKFTDEGGRVEITAGMSAMPGNKISGRAGQYIYVSVSDTGRGIPGDEMAKIFDRFYKGTPKNNEYDNAEGSGIGLALCKLLIELHHGEIFVESREGIGTTFTVTLPVGREHFTEDEIREEQIYNLRMDYTSLNIADDDREVTVGNERIDRDKNIMLVVDDNPAVCQVLSDKFCEDFTVITSRNGNEGFTKAKHFLPDVIISDVMMPLVDGFAFCHLLKNNISTSHIPVILLTAKSEEEDHITGFSSGADAYIPKPYNPDLLRANVDNLLNNRKLLRKKYLDQSGLTSYSMVENKLDEQFLRRLVSLIESEKFSEISDVSALCLELGMSRSVIYRKVKMLTDNSIQDFIRNVRLRKAARLLLESTLSVSEIAYISGFANTKHFSTAFRKLFGKTPSLFRLKGPV